MSHEKKAAAFEDMLIASMLDAANGHLTQLKAVITPEGKSKPVQVRIIVIPEQMTYEFPQGLQKETKDRGDAN